MPWVIVFLGAAPALGGAAPAAGVVPGLNVVCITEPALNISCIVSAVSSTL